MLETRRFVDHLGISFPSPFPQCMVQLPSPTQRLACHIARHSLYVRLCVGWCLFFPDISEAWGSRSLALLHVCSLDTLLPSLGGRKFTGEENFLMSNLESIIQISFLI